MALIVQNSFERTQDETKNFGQDHLVTSTKQNVKIMMFKIICHLFLKSKACQQDCWRHQFSQSTGRYWDTADMFSCTCEEMKIMIKYSPVFGMIGLTWPHSCARDCTPWDCRSEGDDPEIIFKLKDEIFLNEKYLLTITFNDEIWWNNFE